MGNHNKRILNLNPNMLLVFIDIVIITMSWVIAMFLRFEGDLGINGRMYLERLKEQYFLLIIIQLSYFIIFKIYRIAWQYASLQECMYIVVTTFMGFLTCFLESIAIGKRLPFGVCIIAWMLMVMFTIAVRLSNRIMNINMSIISRNHNQLNIMVVGAGSSGAILIKEMQRTGSKRNPVVAVDDDMRKQKQRIHGVIVEGNRIDIPRLVKKYSVDEILIALPSISNDELRNIFEICASTGVKLKTMPSLKDIIEQDVGLSQLRDVSIEDLLGREPVELNMEEISDFISNEIVLVTGGGGSIGSEICRQIAKLKPNLLIIFDIYENNAYDIEVELRQKYGSKLNLEVRIGSVRDEIRLEEIFQRFYPTIVFHAAAHKHVPLMEDSPYEAIKNNDFGTYHVAKCADKYNIKSFVLISTDKAVNPTNVMGASKRIAELIVQHMSGISETKFVAVRFGNVLGSNGSVIPLFKKQIAQGGPVTVTHPNMTRFFMTIPEASRLVIQAGATAQGGEIFILDMGKSVKIDDLAKNLIRLSGFEPGTDIEIKYTGLRPGEKMYEELLLEEEGITATKYKKLHVAKPIELTNEFWNKIQVLEEAVNDHSMDLGEIIEDIIGIKLNIQQ